MEDGREREKKLNPIPSSPPIPPPPPARILPHPRRRREGPLFVHVCKLIIPTTMGIMLHRH
uniref:Uncharacterized protein n=1 Tax=Oryza meridionalis TaxID=40149 RepID=A0A0E0F7V1_9ORYZ